MVVGYWNVQRASNPETNDKTAAARWGLVQAYLDAWVDPNQQPNVAPPDILFLTEITQSGDIFAAYLNAAWRQFGYVAQFIPVTDKNNNVSPCSFILIAKRNMPRFDVVGASTKRPMVVVYPVGGVVIAATHMIANRSKSLDEMFTMCADLAAGQDRAFLIGDMNYKYADLLQNVEELGQFATLGFQPNNPGLVATYKGGYVLDFAMSESGLTSNATPPYPVYGDFDVIDHAPIAYEIR